MAHEFGEPDPLSLLTSAYKSTVRGSKTADGAFVDVVYCVGRSRQHLQVIISGRSGAERN
ncbi:MAG UNVERIFIED_CONTAM: hypothetical protein LVR18_04715 [Planctomycetaceae bacterium]